MTEKHYGGASGFGAKHTEIKKTSENSGIKSPERKENKDTEESDFTSENIEKIKKAGEIASKAKEYAKTIVKPNVLLKEIAEKIEEKIIELGGKPAFPVNLSINEVAAHYTPSFNDEEKAHGLLKVDLGCHIDGFTADTAFSVDLENSEENKNLIEAAESSLKKAIENFSEKTKINEIGKTIEEEAKKFGVITIRNLSGHSMNQYELHSGITIPNFDNFQKIEVSEGLYAIEPFTTTGFGLVRDGRPSGIYQIEKPGSVRDQFAREVLEYISEEYSTLPFCSRWIYKKFGSRGLLALRQIESSGILHHYPQLIEKGNGKVAQAENTILISKEEKTITTF